MFHDRMGRRAFGMGLVAALGLGLLSGQLFAGEKKTKVMIIGGQNNHNWAATTPLMADVLKKAGNFEVMVYNTPGDNTPASGWDAWQPKFKDFDCIILDYNGQNWPERCQKDFLDFVSDGGGVVAIHAANNSFSGWKEYEKIIGMLWRGTESGYSIYLDDDGKVVREEPGKGRGMGHGSTYDWVMTVRDKENPITAGMPAKWMHKNDELYHGQRGPAKNMHILLTAYSDPAPGRGGTGKNEPMVWWIPYGKGKVLVNLMGHAPEPMKCVGFQTLLKRSCEWLATGKCSPLPANFPKADKVSTVE